MPQPLRPLTPAKGPGHQFGASLRARRTAAGLTQQALALLVPVSAALIGKVEKAERQCDVRLARRLDEILDAAGALLAEWEHTLGTAVSNMPRALGARPLPAPGPWAGWDDALGVADQTSLLADSNVDDTALMVLAACCDDLVARYEAEGPFVLAPTGRRLRAQLHHLLAGHQHPAQRHRLYELAAMASGLLAYMSVNAGRLPLARAYCEEALTLARAIDATDLVAWTRGTQSLEAYYAGRYLDARDFALAGIDAAPTSPQAVRLLANGAARALAKLGDRHAAEQALDRARAISDRHELPGDLTSCISFGAYGLARTLANAATVHQILGDTPAVLRYATEVDQHVEAADSDWSRALVTLDVATALLNQPSPEIEQAMQLGRRALTSSGSHPIRSVVQRAGELCTRASQLWPDGAPVHEYEDALSQWRTEPASDILLDPAPAS